MVPEQNRLQAASGGRLAAERFRVQDCDPLKPFLAITVQSKAE